MAGFPIKDRLVEVIADRGEGAAKRYRYGSGCRVLDRIVLTAAHVVEGAASLSVRGTDKRELATKVLLLGDSTTADLALLEITEATYDVPPMRFAKINREAPGATSIEDCHAIGYPAFMEVMGHEGTVRETLDAPGVIPVLSGLVGGLISLFVSNSPRELPPEKMALGHTQWSGMSGAPVVAGEHLVGVVTEHAPRAGKNAVTATPLTQLNPDPKHSWAGVGDPQQWWKTLGVGSTPLALLPPEQPEPVPPYRATVRDQQGRTGLLVGRQRELAQIAKFATSPEPYRRVVGDAWAGKSALMAEAALTTPAQVDVVFYFISRRSADADANKFLARVVPQLAFLIDPSTPAPSVDRDSFLDLWDRALDAARSRGHHLLLIVDGLDEDLHPPGSPTVASLLPVVKPASGGHVLVTNRGSADSGPPPPWLNGAPPLLVDTPVVALAPTAETRERQRLAEEEIGRLKESQDTDLTYGVLGTMAAAAGPLALDDLEALLPDVSRNRISRFLTTDAARTFRPRNVAGERAYEYSHDALLEASREGDLGDGLDVPRRRRAIYEWAARWQHGSWLPDPDTERAVPGYLLDAYAATLSKESEDTTDWGSAARKRLESLLSDVGWVDAAVVRLGVDHVIATLRSAAQKSFKASRISSMQHALDLQAHHLRLRPEHVTAGLTATQVSLGALELREGNLVDQAGAWLQGLPGNHLIPRWSKKRQNLHVIGDVGLSAITAVAVMADGKVVVAGETVRLWDPKAPDDPGRVLGRQESWDEVSVFSVAVTAKGKVVSGSGDGVVRLWDPSARDDLGRVLGFQGTPVTAVAVTSEGKVVSGGGDGVVRLWDPSVPHDPGCVLGRQGTPVSAVAVTAEGNVVSGSYDWNYGAVRLWDPRTPDNEPGRVLGHHGAPVNTVAVTAEGKVVSGCLFGAVRLWDPSAPDDDPGRFLGYHEGSVSAVAATPDGKVVSGGDDGLVRLWDPRAPDNDPGRVLGHHEGSVSAVAVTAEGNVVSGGVDRVVRLWHPGDPRDPGGVLGYFEGDGKVVSGGDDWDGWEVRLWDPSAPDNDPGRVLGRQEGWDEDSMFAVAVTSEGKVVSGGDDGVVRLWDPSAPDNDPGRVLGHHEDRVSAVAVTPDGKVVSGDDDGVVRLWDPNASAEPGGELARFGGTVRTVAVNRLDSFAVVTFDGLTVLDLTLS